MGADGAGRPPGRGNPGRPGTGWPGRLETGCIGRPCPPGRCGNFDCGPPGRWPVIGRGGAGGFTRAPGGSGFQFGLGGVFTVVPGRTAVPGFKFACEGAPAVRPAPGGTGDLWGAPGGGITGRAEGATGAAGTRSGGLAGGAGGAAAGLAATGGAGVGFGGITAGGGAAGATTGGLASTGGAFGTTTGTSGIETTGTAATGIAATGAGGGITGTGGAGGGGATVTVFVRDARNAASFATLSEAAFSSAAASALARSRKCFRTFSAAATSMELECVFFSVTPASGK